MLQLEEEKTSPTAIKVVGVGGAGMNAVNRMITAELRGVDFVVINTDEQVLKTSAAPEQLAIGQKTTRGMGAGGDPDIGLKAAMEDRDRVSQILKGADMVFITAGMGGGTGTGAAPIVAQVAKEMGALTVGVVTMPFAMEGGKRMELARRGLEALREKVDTLITIRNDSIFKVIDQSTPVDVAFRLVDEILLNAVKGISDLINTAGLVNVDFADVRSIMDETGDAIMGAGEGVGENRVADAVNQAIHNALLEETSIEGANALLINVCGGEDMSITEWKDVSELITRQVDPRANIIIGLTIDRALRERIRVTVIATGFHMGFGAEAGEDSAAEFKEQSLPRAVGDDSPRMPATPAHMRGTESHGPAHPTSAAASRPSRPAPRPTSTGAGTGTGNAAGAPDWMNHGGAAQSTPVARPRSEAMGQPSAVRGAESTGRTNVRPRGEVEAQAVAMSGDLSDLNDGMDQLADLTDLDELPQYIPEQPARNAGRKAGVDMDDLEIPAYLRRRNRG
ncbi:MAG: cell division protein FtsZ [bacterium]|nr:cell division protein FtsZ [bacterium]